MLPHDIGECPCELLDGTNTVDTFQDEDFNVPPMHMETILILVILEHLEACRSLHPVKNATRNWSC